MPPPVRKVGTSTAPAPVSSPVPKSGVTGPAIIIDLGSFETKVAFSNKLDKAQTFPTVVAYQKEKDVVEQERNKDKKIRKT